MEKEEQLRIDLENLDGIRQRFANDRRIVKLCHQLKQKLREAVGGKESFLDIFGREPSSNADKLIDILLKRQIEKKRGIEPSALAELLSLPWEEFRIANREAREQLEIETSGTLKIRARGSRPGGGSEITTIFISR